MPCFSYSFKDHQNCTALICITDAEKLDTVLKTTVCGVVQNGVIVYPVLALNPSVHNIILYQ